MEKETYYGAQDDGPVAQDDDPGADDDPLGQAGHFDDPAALEYVPAEHTRHSDPAVEE